MNLVIRKLPITTIRDRSIGELIDIDQGSILYDWYWVEDNRQILLDRKKRKIPYNSDRREEIIIKKVENEEEFLKWFSEEFFICLI